MRPRAADAGNNRRARPGEELSRRIVVSFLPVAVFARDAAFPNVLPLPANPTLPKPAGHGSSPHLAAPNAGVDPNAARGEGGNIIFPEIRFSDGNATEARYLRNNSNPVLLD